jgi:isoquinoline 1-oxidoreductase beta subunit
MNDSALPGIRRRTALTGAAGLTVAWALPGCSLVPPIPQRPMPTEADAAGWIRLSPAGRFDLWCVRMEMGQHITAALREVAALELGVPPGLIDTRLPATTDVPPFKATVGSDSVRELLLPLATACATLRTALVERAALRLGQAVTRIHVNEDGRVEANGRSLALSDLAEPALVLSARSAQAGSLRAPMALAVRSRDAAAPLVRRSEDIALVTGQPCYTADIRLPGLRHATVLHPPWRRELGPRLVSLDEAALSRVPGFVAVLHIAEVDGPVLLADHPGALPGLRQAARPRWELPGGATDPHEVVDVDRALSRDRFTQDSGRVAEGAWTVDLRLDIPMAAHAALEPRCAIARFNADGTLELWCGSQDPFYMRDVLARDQGLSVDKVRVHAQRMGGAFGSRTVALIEREVAFIARAAGQPVKLQWTREDEFVAGFHRPPSSHRVRVRLDSRGRISDWWHALSSSHIIFTSAGLPRWLQALTDFVGDPGTSRGLVPPYAIERRRESLQLTRLSLATGPWRGLGAGPNALAIESAMDALARASGQDPVAFRLRHLDAQAAGPHLPDPDRLARVLRSVSARAAAHPRPTPAPGERIGRGVACGVYKGLSFVAAVAEVLVSHDRIRVTRLWCDHDCGTVVDAQGVRAQIEGCLVWSLSMVLHEALPAPEGRAAITGLAGYPLPRMPDMPILDIRLVNSSDSPGGAGEPALVAGAGAVFNALVDASGHRPQRLPVRPDDLPIRTGI